MNPLHNFNQALTYIEEHLDGEIDLSQVANRACCSQYHFTRTFTFLAGISLTEYIRRRRMSLAAIQLRNSKARVIDIAVQYGYSSADAFSRAFAAVHGVPPSQSRDANLKAYPKMSFQLTIQGGEDMNYRIVTKQAFQIVGVKRRVRLVYRGINPEIAAMFASLEADTIATIKELSNSEPSGLIQATANFSEDREEGSFIDHYIGAATTKPAPAEMETLQVPACEWAVFATQGPFPSTMQSVWPRIYTEWFPSSGYQHAAAPELVWSEHRDITDPNFRNEIWIPVEKTPTVS
jgi:AraC family transcriptional regulator